MSAPEQAERHSSVVGQAQAGPVSGARAELARLKQEIAGLIEQGVDGPRDESVFTDLALRLFACQFELIEPYRRFCERRGRTAQTVSHWKEIPGVPIGAFKRAVFAAGPTDQAEALFMTSGTTSADQRGRHFHLTLDLYNRSAATNFAAHVVPDGARLRLLILNPPPELTPHSALSYYLDLMGRRFGREESRFFIGEAGLDRAGLVDALREVEQTGEPVCLLGATFAYVHFLEYCQTNGQRFTLPAGSRIFDTGGVKGKSREVGRDELYRDFQKFFDVPSEWCVNMYGMTESSTQFIDNTIRNRHRRITAPRAKTVAPWARTVVLDPETMVEAAPGQLGLLQHVDLANYGSAMVLLTEDLGQTVGDGFELIGRARGAEARGCSLAIDELLTAMKSA